MVALQALVQGQVMVQDLVIAAAPKMVTAQATVTASAVPTILVMIPIAQTPAPTLGLNRALATALDQMVRTALKTTPIPHPSPKSLVPMVHLGILMALLVMIPLRVSLELLAPTLRPPLLSRHLALQAMVV
jgi:hypothetical protein